MHVIRHSGFGWLWGMDCDEFGNWLVDYRLVTPREVDLLCELTSPHTFAHVTQDNASVCGFSLNEANQYSTSCHFNTIL